MTYGARGQERHAAEAGESATWDVFAEEDDAPDTWDACGGVLG